MTDTDTTKQKEGCAACFIAMAAATGLMFVGYFVARYFGW